jgi:N-formylglutamate deformylase
MRLPSMIIHVPHASKVIPEEIREQFILDDQTLKNELRLMTDSYTDELFKSPEELARTVAFPVSRLVVDPERFADDSLEIMVQKGMGVVYTRTAVGTPLRRELTADERQRLIDQFYWPHHRQLSSQVSHCLH